MAKRRRRQHPAARGALQETLLQKIGLDDVLDRVARLRERRGDRFDPNRAAREIHRDHVEIAPVHHVEADIVDLEQRQRARREFPRDLGRALDDREVAHAAQQAPGDARRAPRAACDFARAALVHRDAEHARAAPHDRLELLDRVEIEPHRNAETIAQRRRQQAGARRRADQRKAREVDLDGPRRRPLADDEIELKILHRGIEDFLDRRVQAMDLVDEQHVARLEIGELRGEIARLGDDGAGRRAKIDAELARDDLRQRRLAEARRADEQHMIERVAARLGRLDEDLEVFARRLLAGEIGERQRPDRRVLAVVVALFGRQQATGWRGQKNRSSGADGRV